MNDAAGPRASSRPSVTPPSGAKRTPNLIALRSSPPERSSPPSKSTTASASDRPKKPDPATAGPVDPETVWQCTKEYASERTADDALIRELELEGGGADRICLRLVDSRTSTASFVQSNLSRIEKIVQKAVGRRVAVELAAPAQRQSSSEPSTTDEAIVENPLVRKAVGLFDATIHSVRRLPGQSDDEAGSDNPDSTTE